MIQVNLQTVADNVGLLTAVVLQHFSFKSVYGTHSMRDSTFPTTIKILVLNEYHFIMIFIMISFKNIDNTFIIKGVINIFMCVVRKYLLDSCLALLKT